MPSGLRTWLERSLRDAAIPLDVDDAVFVAVVGVSVAGLVTAAVNPLLAPVTVTGSIVAVPVALMLARGRALRALLASLPAFVELVAARLRSGHTVATALNEVAGRSEPVAGDVARVVQRIELGAPLAGALASWADERRLEAVRAIAGSLSIASETGGTAASALDGLARSLRDQLGVRAESAALSAQARMSALVVGSAPLLYVVFAAAVDPASAALLVTTGAGRLCLALGIGLDALGALWMRAIVRSEP